MEILFGCRLVNYYCDDCYKLAQLCSKGRIYSLIGVTATTTSTTTTTTTTTSITINSPNE